ncbi:hypothetical protein O181_047678 [Austropuccinia psidii MF-1]|uniref:Uncharacterized protein n=1 Tax=Austropuccinia psidii MF-1 TaxID=1389203 RepID=A0A9Q3DUE9_9BASI|nr:hypothetical protein [Austropuccinia psidii MF-1]
MAKDGAGRRIQGIRIMQSKPENFSNEDGPESSYGPSNWAPINHSRPPLKDVEGHISYGPGPSQWAQAMWVSKWSMAIFMVPWTPWIPSMWVNFGLGVL